MKGIRPTIFFAVKLSFIVQAILIILLINFVIFSRPLAKRLISNIQIAEEEVALLAKGDDIRDIKAKTLREDAIELAKGYARDKEIFPAAQDLVDNMKGDFNLIGWQAIEAINVGNVFSEDLTDESARLISDAINILKQKLSDVREEGYDWYEGSIFRDVESIVTPNVSEMAKLIGFYKLFINSGQQLILPADAKPDEEEKKVIEDLLNPIRIIVSGLRNSYYYDDDLYFVSFTYQSQEDRKKDVRSGFFFEVDLDSKIARMVTNDPALERKYKLRGITRRPPSPAASEPAKPTATEPAKPTAEGKKGEE